jgi:hypothetical protein
MGHRKLLPVPYFQEDHPMRPDQVAKTMCDALAYAARQASSPIFEEFRPNPGHPDFTLRVSIPGGKRYVVRVEADDDMPEDQKDGTAFG